MDFSAFDKTEIERFAAEAKEKWGKTDAYKEFEQKQADQTVSEQNDTGSQLMNIFVEMGKIRQLPADSAEAQAKAAELRAFITKHYYNCTVEIFSGLGQMYAADPDFKKNIDNAGGAGTAEFSAKTIEIYCGRND